MGQGGEQPAEMSPAAQLKTLGRSDVLQAIAMMESRNMNPWGRKILDSFHSQIEAYKGAFTERVFSSFESIESQAEEYMERIYEELGRMPSDGSIDMADIAEYSLDQAIDHYQTLRGVRQSMFNIALAGLYHLLEQQKMLLLRRELLDRSEENDQSKISFQEFRKRLHERGIIEEKLSGWAEIEELRLIANVTKHGEGKSAEELRSLRPDIFSDPQLSDETIFQDYAGSVFLPMAGEDLYATASDLTNYAETVKQFWTDLLTKLFQSSLGSA